MIRELIERGEAGRQTSPDEIERLVNSLDAQGFLDWVKGDREYSYYYYDAQQSGACAKPREAAAAILEAIALDNIR
jgi:hypothetical protein